MFAFTLAVSVFLPYLDGGVSLVFNSCIDDFGLRLFLITFLIPRGVLFYYCVLVSGFCASRH